MTSEIDSGHKDRPKPDWRELIHLQPLAKRRFKRFRLGDEQYWDRVTSSEKNLCCLTFLYGNCRRLLAILWTRAMFEKICAAASWCPRQIFDALVELALEIAREGREGRRIGTIFTLGAADQVLRHSRPLILDPLALHPDTARHITSANLRGTIKELAQLDGAFVIDESGVVVAACRYLDTSAEGVAISFGLGSRHMAAASITKTIPAIAVVVSESAVVRIFYKGVLEAEILPELWLFSRHSLHLQGPIHRDNVQDLAIFTTEPNPPTAGSPVPASGVDAG
jgi:diadenylate cyclase